MENIDNERVSQMRPVFICEMDSEMDKQMDSFSHAVRRVQRTAVRTPVTSGAYACSLQLH